VSRRGLDGLVEVIGTLQGAALPASVLEADILPVRMADYRGADLDALCTAGEVVWIGAGSLGAKDGRVRLLFRDQAAQLTPPVDGLEGAGPAHVALLDHLDRRGASFWTDLVRACAEAGAEATESSVLAALWDLVWAGLVTNDSLAPVRAFVAAGGRRPSAAPPRGRPRLARLSRLGPAPGAGRWSLVAPLLEPAPSPTEAAHQRALQLLERYGVLTREAALGEGVEGGFAGVYPVLKALEDRGAVRRGYFVAGLGAAQFALPGAVDRLRGFRSPPEPEDAEVLVLAATDPGQPYGAALPWPEPAGAGRPSRSAGAFVVLDAGGLVAFLDRGAHSLVTFAPAPDSEPGEWVHALRSLVARGRFRSLEIRKVDGGPVLESPVAGALKDAGFVDGYRGLVYRR
jgi:ATP-dependent Lhr-like helicase